MTRETKPFRITLILDGDNAVAQMEQMERIINDDGTVHSSRALPAEPLPFPFAKKFLDKVTAEALAATAQKTAEVAAKEKEKTDAIAAKDAELSAKDAEIAAAKAEADEIKSALTIIETAIDDPAIDDAATLAIAKAEAQKSKLTKRHKELAALDAQIAELQAKRAEVRDKVKA